MQKKQRISVIPGVACTLSRISICSGSGAALQPSGGGFPFPPAYATASVHLVSLVTLPRTQPSLLPYLSSGPPRLLHRPPSSPSCTPPSLSASDFRHLNSCLSQRRLSSAAKRTPPSVIMNYCRYKYVGSVSGVAFLILTLSPGWLP